MDLCPETLLGPLRVPHSQYPLPLLRLPQYCCKTPAMKPQAVMVPTIIKRVLVRQVCVCLISAMLLTLLTLPVKLTRVQG